MKLQDLSSPSGIPYVMYINKHMHTHANYFVHPINTFYFHNLLGVIALFYILTRIFLIPLTCVCACIPKENNLLSRTPSDTRLYLFV